MRILFFFCFFILVSLLPITSKNNITTDSKNKEFLPQKLDTTLVHKYITLAESSPEGSSLRLDYLQKGLDTAQSINWENGIGLCNYYIAWYFLFNNNSYFSRKHFLTAAEHSTDPSIIVNSYGIVANIYSWEKKFDEAFEYSLKGYNLIQQLKDSVDNRTKAESISYLADTYRYSGKKEEVRPLYLRAYHYATIDPAESPSNLTTRFYTAINTIDETIGDPIEVLNGITSIKEYYDQTNTIEKYKIILSLIKIASAYTTSSLQEKVQQIQLENEIKQRNMYIIGIVLLFFLLTILVWQNYLRKKAIKKLAEANETKSQFFSILNHDLRRPVAGLISFLQLKTVAPQIIDPLEASNFEKKTIETAKSLLENMENLLFWCKDQMQTFSPQYEQIEILKLFEDTASFFSYEEKIKIDFNKQCSMKIRSDEDYVKTIMRNLTSNAISATKNIENPIIRWSCFTKNGKKIVAIYNNGGRIPTEKMNIVLGKNINRNIKEGIGLSIIKDLSHSIQCKIDIIFEDENSTTFHLIFD